MPNTSRISGKKAMKPDNILALDITAATIQNKNYREVLSTTEDMQLVLMSLKPGEEIGLELHPDTTQFIRVVSGHGEAILHSSPIRLYPGMALFIPAGTEHNVINTGSRLLKLYSLYAPPEHEHGLVQQYKPPHE